MSATDYLEVVFWSMPAAVLLDVIFFTFGLVAVRFWRERRR